MNTFQIFSAVGLVLNIIGSVILIFPNFWKTRNIDDDLIIMDDNKRNFSQRKHIKIYKINLWGFGFLIVGFVLQFISIFV